MCFAIIIYIKVWEMQQNLHYIALFPDEIIKEFRVQCVMYQFCLSLGFLYFFILLTLL